jgi:hypothetical protein
MGCSGSCIVHSPRQRGSARLRAPFQTTAELAPAHDAKQSLTSRPPNPGRHSFKPTGSALSLVWYSGSQSRAVIAPTWLDAL